MSEMRRAARSLVEHRTETFESRHPLEESKRRLAASLAMIGTGDRAHFTPRWSGDAGRPVLHAEFAPSRRTRRLLNGFSVGLALLVAASAWSMLSGDIEGSAAFLLPLFTGLAILGFPFVALGLASRKAADEARIARAIRIALLDEEERFPPPHRWADED